MIIQMGNTPIEQPRADLYFGDDRYSVGKSVTNTTNCTVKWNGNYAIFTLNSWLGTFDKIQFTVSSNPETMGNKYWFKVIGKDASTRTITCAFVDNDNNVVNPRDTGIYSTDNSSGNWYVGGYLNIPSIQSTYISNRTELPTINYNIPNVRGTGSINTCVDNKGVMRYDGEIVYTSSLTDVQFDSITCDGVNQLVLDIKAARVDGVVTIDYDDEYCNGLVKDVIWMEDGIYIIPTEEAKGLMAIQPISSTVNTTDRSLGVSDVSTSLVVSDSSYAIPTTITDGQYINLSVLVM